MSVTVPKFLHDYIAGAVSGCAGMIVGHPLDTIKVQLQTQVGKNKYNSLKSCIKAIKEQNLSKGFFRGMSIPLISYGAVNSIYFGVYRKTLNWLTAYSGRTKDSHFDMCIAGSVAGLAQLVLACPIDVVKVVLQSQIPHYKGEKLGKYYSGPVAAVCDIIKQKGIAGLYRGVGTQLMRDIPSSGIYMFTYEYLRANLSLLTSFLHSESKTACLISGGIAGVVSWMIIIPFDVVKSRLQADTEQKQYKNLVNCIVKSYREGGITSFFRGGAMVSFRAFPVNAVVLLTYSECLKLLGDEDKSF